MSAVKIPQTILTPEGVHILLLFFTERFSVKKFSEKFDGKSAFQALHQNRSHIGKNYTNGKETALVLIFHFK